jgi:hypothetical protein
MGYYLGTEYIDEPDPLAEPIPRSAELVLETLEAFRDPAVRVDHARFSSRSRWQGIIETLEWAIGIREQTPVYHEWRDGNTIYPLNKAVVEGERMDALDQMTGREEPAGQSSEYYRGVENACSWLLGNDDWLSMPQVRTGFRWALPQFFAAPVAA